jgi:hypothetical protein
MKVLIIENTTHFMILANLYHLINNNCGCECELTFYAGGNIKTKERKELLFPEYKSVCWIKNPFHWSLLYFWLIFVGWRYQVINISTGPEGGHWSGMLNVIFFKFFCILYGNKSILTVKNTRDYLSSSKSYMSYMRNKSIKHIKAFTFETKTLRDVFHRETGVDMSRLGVTYGRYTDLNIINTSVNDNTKYYNEFSGVIGLLGAVEERRRNYSDIIDALKDLSLEKRKKLLFVTLGNTPNGVNNKVIKELKKLTNVDCKSGWLSAEELEVRGLTCDVLISPLREDFEYGTYKGSGSFCDAILLRKKIITPYHVDPQYEFKDISIYYGKSDTLSSIFNEITRHINKKTSSEYYNKFTTKNVYKELAFDLSLNKFCNHLKK